MSCGRILVGGLIGVMVICNAASSDAEDERKQPPASSAPRAPATEQSETLKERLSDKATDDQRVDNCNVPPDRRGPRVRPQGCTHDHPKPPLPKLPH
jgi:hypothetical protein